MKKIFLHILLLHLTVAVNAATYYFSSAGNDSYTSAQAQSTATPWKTIAKLNAIMSTLKPGDKVMFKRGETFDGAFVVTVSGLSNLPITFSAYGSGNKPTINGFNTLGAWTQSRSNVWEAPLNVASGKESVVTMNGVQQAIGRYPNSNAANGGYLTIDSHNGLTELVSNQLSASSNWTGGDITIRKNRWTLDRSTVTYQYGGTIGFVSGSTNSITDKYGFFIQNHTNTLDQNGEWFYDRSRGKLQMYFSGNNPGAYAVKASSVETLVSISFQSYISFANLNFTGANSFAINLINSNNISVNNCDFSYTGINAIMGLSSDYMTLTNSTITNTNNNGVYMYWNCSNAVMTGNTLKNNGLIPGMGQNSTDTYQGIFIRGDYNLIQYNEVDSSGLNGIHFEGNYSTVANNFVNVFGLTLDDCGGIYTGQGIGDNTVFAGKSILNNIVLNGIGAPNGTNDTTASTQGIYLDGNSNHVLVSGNTTAYCGQAGIFSNINNNVTITNNTMFNNGIEQFLGTKQYAQGNVRVTNNIMFSKTASQFGTRIESNTGYNDISAFGSFDSNYYCRPIDNNYQFFTQYYSAGNYNKSYDNLSGWTSKFGFDKNSKGAPATIAPCVYSSPSGVNKYTNGTYNSSVSDVGSFSATGDMAKTWIANKLDAGTLQVTSGSYTDNNTYMLTLPLNSNVDSGKSYMLSFSLQGGAAGRPLDVYLRTRTTGNADLTARTKVPIDVTRTDVQFGLTATASSTASIELDVSAPNGALWVDNVNLQEATVTPTNMDDYIVFKYNPTKTSRKFVVSGTYYDAKGNTYTGKITLAPYSSIVLFKQDGTTATFKTSAQPQSIKVQGTMNDASAASFTASSSSANVNWQVENQSTQASYYTVERSSDATSFMLLGKTTVKKSGTSAISYEYNDAAPKAGKNWYRLTQYDEKGVAGESKIVMVHNLSVQVNPNPVQNTMHLFFNGTITANDHVGKDILIRNLSGATVKTLQLPATDNISMANLDVSSLTGGMYIVSITAEGKTISRQFLKL